MKKMFVNWSRFSGCVITHERYIVDTVKDSDLTSQRKKNI